MFARTVCCAPVDVFKTDREREITFSAREEEEEECIRKESIDCARAFRHSRERRRDASIQCAEIPRWSSKQREREKPFLKKKRTVRVSRRRRRRLSGGGGGGSVMMMRAVVVVVVVVVVAILQRREKIHRRCLRSFGGHFLCLKNKSPRRMFTRLSCEKTRETRRAREGFCLFVRPNVPRRVAFGVVRPEV